MNAFLIALGLAGWLAIGPIAATAEEELVGDAAEAAGTEGSESVAAASEPPPEVQRKEADPELSARGEYNAGLELLRAGDYEAAAEAFLRSRDRAGPDPELRYRAAFNLGFALAAGAEDETAFEAGTGVAGEAAGVSPAETAQRTLATMRQSAAWFADAVRLAPPGDDDARINLELVSRRILALVDRLRDADGLQARLDRLIDDQRWVRDRLRGLLAEVEAEAAGAEPHGFREAFDDLASRERMLIADVGDSIDIAEEGRLLIEQTPEAERTAEQRLRTWQLASLSTELEQAVQSLGDARRRLRRLEGEPAHRRTQTALADLKRARERLLDPVRVLGAVARDQAGLVAHTAVLAGTTVEALRPEQPPPRWLTSEHLAERQADVAGRTAGVRDRFEAAVQGADVVAGTDAAGGSDRDTRADRTLRAAAEALPPLDRAVDAMQIALAALDGERPGGAPDLQGEALEGIRQAIEAFAGVRQLVEIAHGDQQGIVTRLGDGDAEPSSLRERTDAILALVDANERRLDRLKGRLEEDRADTVAAIAGDAGSTAQGPTNTDEQRRSIDERYRHAETLRGRALDGLRVLRDGLAVAGAGDARRGADADASEAAARARATAEDVLAALDELRRLFFSIVEHLEALRGDQADTRDRTASLRTDGFEDIDALAAGLGLAAERQREHERLASALAAALAEQADAAVEGAPAGAGTADPNARERLAQAAGEVREAGGRMQASGARLAEAASRAASPMLEPVLEDQLAAIEHLENAIRTLTEREDDAQSQQEGEGSQAEQQQAQPSGERSDDGGPLTQRQALKRLQEIRDREAERRRGQAVPGREPVEKDW